MKPSKNDIPFDFGDKVIIDGDSSIIATVTALANRELSIAWLHHGESRTAWIDQWRLTKTNETPKSFSPIKP